MKKLMSILLAVVLLLSVTQALAEEWTCPSCGNAATGNFCNNCGTKKPEEESVTESSLDTETTKEVVEEAPSESMGSDDTTPVSSENGYSIIKEYKWSSMWGNYYAMVIKNTSGETCSFDVQMIYYDAKNNMVGVSNPSIDVCGDGYEVLVSSSCDIAFDHVEYEVNQKSSWYNDVHSFVEVTAEKAGNKAILKAVNSGTVDAEFVEYNCLFLTDNEEVVGTGWGYLVGDDSSLKSGKVELREESCSSDFSSVAVYFEGRTMSSIVNTDTVEVEDITANIVDGCEISNEYKWSSYWSSNYALAIKNTSGETNGYSARILFYDEKNNIVGVANSDINVLGDGYEALIVASQDNVYDHVSYAIQPHTSYYQDVHSFVEITANIVGDKAILSAKNTGNQAAQFVEYHCLFLDKAGNVVGSDWGYLVDDDSELKPGKTELREANCYDEFESAVVYFEGRY